MRCLVYKFLLFLILIGCKGVNNKVNSTGDGLVYVDSSYIADDNIGGANFIGFKIDKTYLSDSLIYFLKDIISLDTINGWRFKQYLSIFSDTCSISSKKWTVGKIGTSEIQEIIFTIDSCLNPNSLYNCHRSKCKKILSVIDKLSDTVFKPILFNRLRYDEYPDSVKIYEVEGKKILSIYSTISGNTGETKEFYFIVDNDTLKIFQPWNEINLNTIKLPDSACFKLNGFFDIKTLTYRNYLWHEKDHQHWPTLGSIQINYELKGLKIKIKDYKIFKPTEEQKYWLNRREK